MLIWLAYIHSLITEKTTHTMNFVSYETAVRLKEAGFPQPEPRFFQAWYNPAGDSVYKIPFIIEPAFRRLIDEYSIFAPTADDILRNLPHPEDYKASFDGVLWHIQHYTGYSTYHENFAEAAALMFLPENENDN